MILLLKSFQQWKHARKGVLPPNCFILRSFCGKTSRSSNFKAKWSQKYFEKVRKNISSGLCYHWDLQNIQIGITMERRKIYVTAVYKSSHRPFADNQEKVSVKVQSEGLVCYTAIDTCTNSIILTAGFLPLYQCRSTECCFCRAKCTTAGNIAGWAPDRHFPHSGIKAVGVGG